MEAMIENFAASEFVTKHLSLIENEECITSENYPGREASKSLMDRATDLHRKISLDFKEHTPTLAERYWETFTEIENLNKERRLDEIFLGEYYRAKEALEAEQNELWSQACKQHQARHPEESLLYDELTSQITAGSLEELDWNDRRLAARNKVTEQAWGSYISSVAEGEAWLGAESHEFDDQRFSRQELNRWISENKYPTLYKFEVFASKEDGVLNPKERGTLLVMVAALCKAAEIDYTVRGASTKIVRLLDKIGVPIDSGTVLTVLQQIPDAVGARQR